jgi:hypothetical protein
MSSSKYTCAQLRNLKKINDEKIYNEKINSIVSYIEEQIIKNAKNGITKYNATICLNLDATTIQNSNSNSKNNVMNRNLNKVVSEDTKYINDIMDKLKGIFIDLDIQYLESKDLRGNVLERVIRVLW